MSDRYYDPPNECEECGETCEGHAVCAECREARKEQMAEERASAMRDGD